MIHCSRCNNLFTPQTPDQTMCPRCLFNINLQKNKPKPKTLTFAEISHIADVYHKINNKYIHYGELVNWVDSNPCKCICCGAKVSVNKHVCKECENKYIKVVNKN